MGECIIARSGVGGGGSVQIQLPVLNTTYPVDGYVKYGSSITLSCIVDMYLSDCSYQWYINDQPVSGGTQDTYVFNGINEYKSYNVYCKVSNSIGTVYTRTACITTYPTTFKITDSNNCYIDFDSNLYVNGVSMSLKASKSSVSKTLIPFELYNNIVISVYGTSIDGSIYIGNKNVGQMYNTSSGTKEYKFNISEYKEYTTLKLSNNLNNNYILIINYIRLQ